MCILSFSLTHVYYKHTPYNSTFYTISNSSRLDAVFKTKELEKKTNDHIQFVKTLLNLHTNSIGSSIVDLKVLIHFRREFALANTLEDNAMHSKANVQLNIYLKGEQNIFFFFFFE